MYVCIYIYIYTDGQQECPKRSELETRARAVSLPSVFITGRCSGRGVQWIGLVLYNKLMYNII